MRLTKYERETIFNFNEAEQFATVYTYNKSLQKKLDSLCEQYDQLFNMKYKDNTGAKTYVIPKRYISVRSPKVINEKQKEVMQAAAKRARQQRQSKNI